MKDCRVLRVSRVSRPGRTELMRGCPILLARLWREGGQQAHFKCTAASTAFGPAPSRSFATTGPYFGLMSWHDGSQYTP